MKQPQYSPLSVAEMAISLYAVNEGYLDDVPVEKVVDFEAALHAYASTNASDLIEKISSTGSFDDDIEGQMKKLMEEFSSKGAY